MNVTETPEGNLLVTLTTDERTAFDQSVAAGVIPGGTAAAALQGYIATAFSTMQSTMQRRLVDDVSAKLPALTITQLAALKASLGG